MIKPDSWKKQLSGFLVFHVILCPLNYTKLFFCIIVYIDSAEFGFTCSIKQKDC